MGKQLYSVKYLLILLVSFICVPMLASAQCRTQEATPFYLVAEKSTLWADTEIPVCWENPGNFSEEREWVREAVTQTWQKNSDLTFTGWNQCSNQSKGIRIVILDDWPRVQDFGCRLAGLQNGMILNFIFKDGFHCTSYPRKECIQWIAVHEFGHALGFHHEQNRSDTDRNSKCFKEHYQDVVPDELLITKWDADSVMNYCNENWSGHGQLSKSDIVGLQKIYGERGAQRCKDKRARNNGLYEKCKYGYFFGHQNKAPGVIYVWPSPWNSDGYVWCHIPNHEMLLYGLGIAGGNIQYIGHQEGRNQYGAKYWSQNCDNSVFRQFNQ